MTHALSAPVGMAYITTCLVLTALVAKIHTYSSHWSRVLPDLCSPSAPNAVYNALMDCDQIMDREVKQIFDKCVKDLTGRPVNKAQPRVCNYHTTKKGQQLDNCKSVAYRDRRYTIREIVAKEHKHMWCVMKVARPLGWEHLCSPGLSPQRRSAVRRCDDHFREITDPIAQCHSQVFGAKHDGRPLACRSFEHFSELWQCLERKSEAKFNANPNKLKETEEKTYKYMDCLKDLSH